MVNEQRLLNSFLDMVRIDSESYHEREIADKLAADLKAMGAEVVEDDAGDRVKRAPSVPTGYGSGNLIATFKGTSATAEPILLCSHMDTVVPGKGVKPLVEDYIVRTDGKTVLGGDDKSGLAVIMEAVQTVREQGIPVGDIEVVFTVCEEKGLLGAKALDVSLLRSRYGLVFDWEEPGVLYTKAPAGMSLEWRIFGQAAHAGLAPESGLSAIQMASKAIAQMRLGRIDFETTANLGIINGGRATNIVPQEVLVQGEARSRDPKKLEEQVQHMAQCFQDAVTGQAVTVEGVTHIARLESLIEVAYESMDVPDDAPLVRLVQQAGAEIGVTIPTKAMGGACDANALNGKGLLVANMGTGMRNIHTTNEWLDVRDMVTTTNLVVELLRFQAARSAT